MFGNDVVMVWLEVIVYFVVVEEWELFFVVYCDVLLIVFDILLLFEKGGDYGVDLMIVVFVLLDV